MAEIDEKVALVPRGIVHDPEHCTGCGLCDLMCSLYHEGEQGQAVSRGELVGDRLTSEFSFNVCWQCLSPACHEACPLKDEALVIDEVTGTKYVDPDVCYGCGDCIDACHLEASRIKLYPAKNIVLMCDLCRGRSEGPICIEYCSFDALTLATQKER